MDVCGQKPRSRAVFVRGIGQLQQGSKACFEHSWSWGESNPRPLSSHCQRYDYSRVSDLRLSGYRVINRQGFPWSQKSFPVRQWSLPPSITTSVTGL